jgi:hypothetical protein
MEIDIQGACYRLVDRGWSSLAELDQLSLDDVERANLVLDALDRVRAPR